MKTQSYCKQRIEELSRLIPQVPEDEKMRLLGKLDAYLEVQWHIEKKKRRREE